MESSRREKELWFRMCARTWPGGQSRGFFLLVSAGEFWSKLARRPRRRARDGTPTYLWLSSFVYRLIRLFISSPILKTTATKKVSKAVHKMANKAANVSKLAQGKAAQFLKHLYFQSMSPGKPDVCVCVLFNFSHQNFTIFPFFWFCNFSFF